MRRLIAIALCVGSSVCLAHTDLTGATPASGSILSESPASLELQFAEPVLLTELLVVVGTEPGRKLQTRPMFRSDKFFILAPQLVRGRNELRWKILSRDGHWNEGVVILVVR